MLTKHNYIVNLQKVTLHNFKNVENGEISFQSYKYREKMSKKSKQAKKNNENIYDCIDFQEDRLSDIIGIYGQNGSGKTTFIDAINLLKSILSGQSLPKYVNEFIGHNDTKSRLEFVFYIKKNEKIFNTTVNINEDNQDNESEELLFYNFEIERMKTEKEEYGEDTTNNNEISEIKVVHERIYTKSIVDFEINNISNLIEFNLNSDKEIRYLKASGDKVKLEVAKALADKMKTSFIFGEENYNIFKDFSYILNEKIIVLRQFAQKNLIVIRNDRLRAQKGDDPIPFNLIIYNNNDKKLKEYLVSYNDYITLKKEEHAVICKTMKSINTVISSIIPGLQIEINEIGNKVLNNGEVGKLVELLSVRENVKIPLVCESDGIKKIIAILSALIAMRIDEGVCLLVDELDAGVYEYLLGEILYVLEHDSSGQFIFTSHNLRALETLSKDAIVFTTINPKNRYCRFNNVKPSNNLRDSYIRSLVLGGQKEDLYSDADRNDIGFAFFNSLEEEDE